MRQIDIIENLPKIMSELKKGVLLNTQYNGELNTMTISWGQIGMKWGKMFFTVYIRHGRYTHKLIDGSKEFTISIPKERIKVAKILGYCGSKSKRQTDKIKDMNLTVVKGISVNSPAIKELPITIECKMIYHQEPEVENIPEEIRENCYPQDIPSTDSATNRDYHTIYYGEIVNAYTLDE